MKVVKPCRKINATTIAWAAVVVAATAAATTANPMCNGMMSKIMVGLL